MILATVSFEKSLILKHLVTVFAGIHYLVNFMHVCLVFSQTLRCHKCLSTYDAQIVSSHDSAVCSNNVTFQAVLLKVSDVTLVHEDDEKLEAHKVILAALSPFLQPQVHSCSLKSILAASSPFLRYTWYLF